MSYVARRLGTPYPSILPTIDDMISYLDGMYRSHSNPYEISRVSLEDQVRQRCPH